LIARAIRKLALATDDGNEIGPEIAVKAPAKASMFGAEIVLVADPTATKDSLTLVGGIRLS